MTLQQGSLFAALMLTLTSLPSAMRDQTPLPQPVKL